MTRARMHRRRTEPRHRRPAAVIPSRPCHRRRSGRERGGWGSDAPCRPCATHTGPPRASHVGGTRGCGIAAPGTTRGTLGWCQRREERGSARCLGWGAYVWGAKTTGGALTRVRCRADTHRALGEPATGPWEDRGGRHLTQGVWSFRRAATLGVGGGWGGGAAQPVLTHNPLA